ncbi:uncharacterized protein LOC126770502 [Nymphalis io]|uniref:uncharacterized protein LOC126770502 n=1 Tax=Inachis io TaxID=171585 RepID=UPI00216A9759|nr:uncharacterized protein LOC126770502 [Nymphalis io]XP_050345873.1 uncharacterized protein LOC126770502 [Nymphalis io]
MNQDKLLSGHELVARTTPKIDISLPEIGLKEIIPSGSWLEQKQIQAAVEARKHLIEVERIEKSGTLSHAVWREELMLAEVTQKVGSYWQYLGHNKGKLLYLKPEEALFLMEINCLHLKYNDVKVSLQQAYSLLLKGKITLLQYKVYASLSRLGYRIYRHERVEPTICETKDNLSSNVKNDNAEAKNDDLENSKTDDQENPKNESPENSKTEAENMICDQDTPVAAQEKHKIIDKGDSKRTITEKTKNLCGLSRLQKLKNRKLKPCNINNIHKFFENLPELIKKQIVSIKTPQKEFIPNTICLTKPVFNINLENIHSKNDRYVSMDTNIYTINDEVNGSHIRRIRNTCGRSEPTLMPAYSNFAYANGNFQYRQFNIYRPRHTYSSINFSMLFQRHFLPNWFFTSRLQLPRIQTQYWQTNCNNGTTISNNNNRKRTRITAQMQNLEDIKKLASRLKQLILLGNNQEEFIQSLQRLIQTYNSRYKTRVRLNQDFDVVVEETIVDTIELDDDEEPSRKRRRTVSPNYQIEENFNILKKLACQLKELEKNKKSSARHRRAFSKLLRKFNESYNEEYYLNESGELENRLKIDLDSSDSSNSESLIEELQFRKGKKLRNPFNILKRLSELQKDVDTEASTSKKDSLEGRYKEYSPLLLKTFNKNWLPPENDFGRAEIVCKDIVYNEITDMKREDILFDFLKIKRCECDNWLELKKTFFTSIKEAIAEFQNGMHNNMNNRINSIVKPGDCTDMASILKKLRIIQTEKGTEECDLAIDFDVFSRQVQNFRKTQRPTPHVYIVCVDETKHMPSGSQIANLYSKYDTDAVIIFAVVGVSAISYVQINPIDLPVYVSNDT